MLTKDDLQAISDMLDKKLDEKLDEKLNERFEKELGPIREDMKEMKKDIQGLKGSVDLLNVKVDRNTRRLKDLDLTIRNMKSDSDKKFARLQDGMDTVEQVLKMNNLIPC